MDRTKPGLQDDRPSVARPALAVLLLLAAAALGPTAGAAQAARKATLVLAWSPQAQFAGHYVALEKGIYARHGIDLTIIPGGPGVSPEGLLGDGTADFAVLWVSNALRQRAAGMPVVNLAQVVQRSAVMLVARKSSGIRTVADMQGKKVGVWGGDLAIPPRALLAQAGVTVREVPLSKTVNLFLRGAIDVTSAMWYNEYHTILASGLDPEELTLVSLKDHGLRFPEDGLYALEPAVAADPALAKAFVLASREGWTYAFEHGEEALDIVIRRMREAHLPANRVHQRWMLGRLRELLMPADGQPLLSPLDEDGYRAVGDVLQAQRLIRDYPRHEQFIWSGDARR
jgi:NitT/TauT family transport system substrate-binding protein